MSKYVLLGLFKWYNLFRLFSSKVIIGEFPGEILQQLGDSTDSSVENEAANIKTKKLFVAGTW